MINNNYRPKRGSRRANILETFERYGGMTFDNFLRKCGNFEFSKNWDLKGELNVLVKLNCLDFRNNVYYPKNRTDEHILPDNVVPSREPKPFTPLKTMLPKISPRGQEIERRSFQTCKSRIAPSVKDYL